MRQSKSQRVPPGVSVARPITVNSAVRGHALALQRIMNLEDVLFLSSPYRQNTTGYSADRRQIYVRGS